MTGSHKPKPVAPAEDAMSPDTPLARLSALAKLPDEAVQRALAKNPRTPPKVLKKLGSSRDKLTRKAVAGNPNTPAEIMAELGGQFPLELLGNPSLDLLLLENPDLFSEMPVATLRSLAKRENCPAGLLAYIARTQEDQGLQCSLLQNPNTPREVIEHLAQAGISEEIKDEARLHIALGPELDAEAAEQLFWKSVANHARCSSLPHWQWFSVAVMPEWVLGNLVVWQLLRRPTKGCAVLVEYAPLPLPMLEAIAANCDMKIRRAACLNPAAPDWLRESMVISQVVKGIRAHEKESFARLAKLFKTCPPEYRTVLAAHPLATDEMKRQRAQEWENRNIPVEVAWSPLAWPELLERLADSPSHRWGVAENRNTPAAILERLASDKCDRVRMKVAKHRNTPIHILERLSNDKDEWVRKNITRNPRTSESALRNVLGNVSKDDSFWCKEEVAKNPKTPVHVLEKLAFENPRDGYVLRAVAENPCTPAHVLQDIAANKDDHVRGAVAGNLNTPASVLEELVKEKKSLHVLVNAIENPNTPLPILEKVLTGMSEKEGERIFVAENPRTPPLVLEKLAKDKRDGIRRTVAKNPKTPVSVLAKLADDKYDAVRRGAAENSNTPVSILERLAKDKNEDVREAARNTLEDLCKSI